MPDLKSAGSDGRGGVRVLVAGSALQLFLGIIYVWSVFVAPVTQYFAAAGADAAALAGITADVKLTSSFMLCCFVLGILVGGRVQMRLGAGKTVLCGGLAMAVGMLLSSLVPADPALVWLIYLFYGVVGGFGVGMAYNTIITCAQKWFPAKRGLATGISVCMFGFSTVIFAPLAEWLVSALGLAAAFRVLAIVFALVTAALFGFIRFPAEAVNPHQETSALPESQRQYTTGEMLRTKEFYYIALSMMLFTASYFILNPSFKSLAAERWPAVDIGTVLVQITGVANALGRLATSVLADRIGRERATFSIIALTAVSTALLSFATGFLFVAAVAVIAFCYGGSSGVYPLVTSGAFGLKHVGSNYGAVMVGFMLSALLFPVVVGLISGAAVRFVVLAVMAASGGVLILLLAKSRKNKTAAKGE